MSNANRNWMYQRLDDRGHLSHIFITGVNTFIEFASSKQSYMDGDKIICPCTKCHNKAYKPVDDAKYHLYRFGFVPNYGFWDKHGETSFESTPLGVNDTYTSLNEHHESTYRDMVIDAAGPDFITRTHDEEPNLEDKKFFDMLEAADKELWSGCKKVTQLSVVARLLNIKSEYRIPEQCFDAICQLIKDGLPEENNMVDSLYESKKLIQALGLPVESIDCCRSGCMLYWREDKDLDRCKFCSAQRYKKSRSSSTCSRIPFKRMHHFPMAPRLKRLYASHATAAYMGWHAENHGHDVGVMCHPSDSEAWKHFDISHPSFAAEKRNVRLGLCTDGFQPHGASGKQYSSWPIIITPYNLPPSMCMKEPYMFLTAIVPGPTSPKQKLDVFLQPVVAELKQLWEEGVLTYDVSLKQNFQLRAALMWTISDFPAYGMLSGWATAGKLACPHCGKYSQAIWLENGNKMSWFDCHRTFLNIDHPYRKDKNKFIKNRVETKGPPPTMTGEQTLRQIEQLGLLRVTEFNADRVNKARGKHGWKKRSIFWDLPYWKTNLIRHNLDPMHIEKNVFENLFYTIMDVKTKTKDNANAREDLKLLCRKRNGVNQNQRAYYALEKNQKKALCEWVENLSFPDGYVSNLGRCVDLSACRLFGMKSHDCHVFMQRLLPIAFRNMLPRKVWEAVTELSLFFKTLTSTTITTEDMQRIEAEIPIILCKLETIFVPGFFDSMEHLPVHLPYEAKIAGPVQYRWMYPFERLLHQLKKDVKNKARVEGSICNAYLVREASIFCSHYFELGVYTRNRKVPRNDDGGDEDGDDETLRVFSHPGRPYGKLKSRKLKDDEFNAAHACILFNEEKMQDYIKKYEDFLKGLDPEINEQDLAAEVDKNFATWFEKYARENEIKNKYIRDLSRRPLRTVKSYNVYFVNGYKFHTERHGANKSTMNSGVCISSSFGDYYGRLLEILEVEYPGFPIKTTVLFNCHWYDPTPNVGVRVHNQYKLVDINHRRKFNKFEPFILAFQATQVCFMPYPSLTQNNSDWLAVCKVRPRGWVEIQKSDHQTNVAFQEDEVEANEIISTSTNEEEDVEEEDNILSNESDNENNNEGEGEGEFDDENNDDHDGDADIEDEFEYSTSTDEEVDDEEEYCNESD